MKLILLVILTTLFCSVPGLADIDNCPKNTDLVCHQAFFSLRNFFVFCINTAEKKISHGSQIKTYPQQDLRNPENPKDPNLHPLFIGSLPEGLEIQGADYNSGSGKIIQYAFKISQLDGKYTGTVKSDGTPIAPLTCHN